MTTANDFEKNIAEFFSSGLSPDELFTALADMGTFDRTGELPEGRAKELVNRLISIAGKAPVLTLPDYVQFVRAHLFKLAAQRWYDAQRKQAETAANRKRLSGDAQLAALLVLRRHSFFHAGVATLADTNFHGLGEEWKPIAEAAARAVEIEKKADAKVQQEMLTALAPYFHEMVIAILRAVSLPFSKETFEHKGGSPGIDAALTWLHP